MRRSLDLAIIGCTLGILLSWSLPAFAGSDRYDDPFYCSDWYATHPANSLNPDKHRRCLIAIATTYPDGESNMIPPEDMLLADEVIRYSTNSPRPDPTPGNAERIRDGIRGGATATIADWENPRWTVDLTNNQVFLIWDIILVGFSEPTVFVTEVFTIENGLITEVLIGGVNRTPI